MAVMLLAHIQEVLGLIQDWSSDILTEVFGGTAQPLQAKARIVPMTTSFKMLSILLFMYYLSI